MNDPVTSGAERAPASVDLSGVDPARWPEIRRRVAILEEFVAMHRPPLHVRTAFAHRMGLSVSQFLMLARVWRTTRSASAIPGARSRNTVAKARRLPARSIGIMRETIEALGPMARRKDVIAEVVRLCTAEGIASPSRSTIANALSASRAESAPNSDFAREILIDECVVRLPVARGATVVMPRVLLAIAMPERHILAASIGCHPRSPPSPSSLMAELNTAGRGGRRVRAPHLPDLERSENDGSGACRAGDKPSLSRVLGNRLGDLEIVHRASMARSAATLVAPRHASAIDGTDAVSAIKAAVEAHNAKAANSV